MKRVKPVVGVVLAAASVLLLGLFVPPPLVEDEAPPAVPEALAGSAPAPEPRPDPEAPWSQGPPAEDSPVPAGRVSSVSRYLSLPASAPDAPERRDETHAERLPATRMDCTLEASGALRCGDCREDGECPAGQGCAVNRSTRRQECMASECAEDAHCAPGLACRALNNGATGVVVRRCMPEGRRGEGEACDLGYVSAEGACTRGLICLGGRCGTRCQPGAPGGCPEGHRCEETLEGFACHADCQRLGCPEGQRCKRLDDADSKCLAAVRGECPETPCGEDERCNLRSSRETGVFWCARRCQPTLAQACPAGQVCGMGSATESTCFRACDPRRLDSCGEGWECTTVSEDLSQWGCIPAPGR